MNTLAEQIDLLVVCGEPVGARMAGPAIRALELAAAVAAGGARVTLAAPLGAGEPPTRAGVTITSLGELGLGQAAQQHRAVLVGPGILSRFAALARAPVPLAVDLYDPVPLEAAELFRDAPRGVQEATLAAAAANLRLELTRADMVLGASERQRDLWIGGMITAGRLTPALYADDPTFAGLCRVVPFGVEAGRPERAAPALRGVLPGIGETDPVFIWAGGLHDWFDPEMAVAALARLLPEMPAARLVFMAGPPPNDSLQAHGAAARTRAAAQARDMLDSSVYFLPDWVPYAQRGRYLSEATVGISTHRASLETRYAWRTRLLDYLWAGLPVACTGGDALGDTIGERGAGIAVQPGDVEGLAEAMRRLAAPGPIREAAALAARGLADGLRWSEVARPLVDWVEHPSRTARTTSGLGATTRQWRMLVAKGAHVMRQEGIAGIRRRQRRFQDRD